jgi:hypothetical protein
MDDRPVDGERKLSYDHCEWLAVQGCGVELNRSHKRAGPARSNCYPMVSGWLCGNDLRWLDIENTARHFEHFLVLHGTLCSRMSARREVEKPNCIWLEK